MQNSGTGGSAHPSDGTNTSAFAGIQINLQPPSQVTGAKALQTNWKSQDPRVRGQNARRKQLVERQKQARQRNLAAARARHVVVSRGSTGEFDNSNDNQESTTMDQGFHDLDGSSSMSSSFHHNRASKQNRSRASRSSKRKQEEEAYAAQFQRPEWMLEVPSDLSPDAWSVMPKPEGESVLVIAAHGQTVSRRKNGRILHEFLSALPHGSPQTGTGASEFSMLHCVYHEADKTYYVLDIVWWKGLDVGASDFTFRQFWLHSKLAEVPSICKSSDFNHYRFQPVPVFDCSRQGLGDAYAGNVPFIKDGLLFYYKEGHYEEGLSPCVLGWKDAKTSRYPIDSPDGVNPYPVQTCVFRVKFVNDVPMLQALAGDMVGKLDPSEAATHSLRDGTLARFAVPPGGLESEQEQFTEPNDEEDVISQTESMQTDATEERETIAHVWINGLQYHSSCKPYARPDSSCRVAFQYAMRHNPLTIDRLTEHLP